MDRLLDGFELTGKYLSDGIYELVHHFTEGFGDSENPAKSARAIVFWITVLNATIILGIMAIGALVVTISISLAPILPFLIVAVALLIICLAGFSYALMYIDIDC